MTRLLLRFVNYIWRYKYRFILQVILIILYSIATSLFPLVLGNLVDQVENAQRSLLFNTLSIIAFLGFAGFIIHPILLWVSDQIIIHVSADIREDVFKHLHNLDYKFHSNKSSGSLISMFKRGENAVIRFYDEFNWILKHFFDFLFIIIFSFTVYPKVSFIILILLILNFGSMYFTLKINIRARNRFNKKNDEVTALTVDNMISFDTVKYFAGERYEQNKLSKLLNVWYRKFMDYGNSFRLIDIVNGGIVNIGMIVVIGVALLDYADNIISAGDFVLASTSAIIFFPTLKNLVFEFREIAKEYEDFRYYVGILDTPIDIKDDNTLSDASYKNFKMKGVNIEFRDIEFGYDENIVLKGFNLNIQKGESVALVGRSGAGKSTIVNLLFRFYEAKKGNVLFNGTKISEFSKEQLRKLIGIVPQDTNLFNNTIRYNIAYGAPNCNDLDINKALRMANLEDFINSLPRGLDTTVGERGIKLSGGQKQRVSIARAFLEDAPIIIFDEATSSLDSESEKKVQDAFWHMQEGRTAIIIAHRLATIKKVDRIVVIENGKIIDEGSHEELSDREGGLYKHLIDLQKLGEIEE